MSSTAPAPVARVMTQEGLLAHWQGHRRLTRRVIDAFPDDQLFTFSVGGMRPFGVLALEFLGMAVPTVKGLLDGTRDAPSSTDARPKAEILRMRDEATAEIDTLFPRIPPERFQETITAFGQWTDKSINLLMYIIDNEIHHRGQGYVYLRALGIEPPPFYERQ